MHSRKSDPDRSAPPLRRILTFFLLLAACETDSSPPPDPSGTSDVLQAITRSVEGGTVHQVRMTQHGDRYAFEPAEVTVAPGDVVRFVMVGSQPESVVFDTDGLGAAQAAFVTAHGLNRGVLLTDPGATYDVSFRDAPAGDYPFRSLPHQLSGMRGRVHVQTAGR